MVPVYFVRHDNLNIFEGNNGARKNIFRLNKSGSRCHVVQGIKNSGGRRYNY